MLSDTRPDLSLSPSPNSFHLEQIEAGLKAGVRIFAEKPVVISVDETMRLAELLAKHGTDRIMVGLVLRHSQHMIDLRHAIAEGVLGPITSIEANEHIAPYHGAFFMRDWRRESAHSGGFMLEKCCHDLDLYNMITASRPVRVASFGGRRSFLPEHAPTSNAEAEISTARNRSGTRSTILSTARAISSISRPRSCNTRPERRWLFTPTSTSPTSTAGLRDGCARHGRR